jgi:seryl-tRNA synthetase
MIDLTLMRENTETVTKEIKRKDPSFEIEKLIELDKNVRAFRQHVESLRAEKNELACKARHGVTEEIRSQSKKLDFLLKDSEKELTLLETNFQALYLRCPNIPADDVPSGGKEANRVIKTHGTMPSFSFTPKNHVELGNALGWFDFEAAATMSGSHFVVYKDKAVELIYALSLFMLRHNRKQGYSSVLPPYLINERALEGASNFPRFKEDVYAIEKDKLYLTPTSEVNLANLHRDRILSREELPLRMTSWTSCFRREAGGYGANERGLIRIHQFEKVELYTICLPEESAKEQERMLACAEELLQKLGLHYRVTLLAAQDSSFAATKTYDLEVWMPGQNEYKEVSSVSNCTDFQARRCSIRFRSTTQQKTHLVHTLNASSLALPRVIVALMETYQQEDGSIKIPEILHPLLLA